MIYWLFISLLVIGCGVAQFGAGLDAPNRKAAKVGAGIAIAGAVSFLACVGVWVL